MEGILGKIQQIEEETGGRDDEEAVSRRRQLIRDTDEQGLLATPANSYINELVSEAARISILAEGDWVKILYGDSPRVEKR